MATKHDPKSGQFTSHGVAGKGVKKAAEYEPQTQEQIAKGIKPQKKDPGVSLSPAEKKRLDDWTPGKVDYSSGPSKEGAAGKPVSRRGPSNANSNMTAEQARMEKFTRPAKDEAPCYPGRVLSSPDKGGAASGDSGGGVGSWPGRTV